MEQIVDIFIILALLVVAYVQLVIMLIELRKVLSEVKKCSQTATASGMNCTKNCRCGFLIFLLH